MTNKRIIYAAAGIVVLTVWVTVVINDGLKTLPDWLKAASYSASVLGIAAFAFNTWAWRWFPLAFRRRPIISGTWLVTAKAWDRERRPVLFEGYMLIKQKYNSLSMRLVTKTTESELIFEYFHETKSEAYELFACYYCQPRAGAPPGVRDAHYGAMRLELIGDEKNMRMEGIYWTYQAENSIGTLYLTNHVKDFLHDYETAHGHYSQKIFMKESLHVPQEDKKPEDEGPQGGTQPPTAPGGSPTPAAPTGESSGEGSGPKGA